MLIAESAILCLRDSHPRVVDDLYIISCLDI